MNISSFFWELPEKTFEGGQKLPKILFGGEPRMQKLLKSLPFQIFFETQHGAKFQGNLSSHGHV